MLKILSTNKSRNQENRKTNLMGGRAVILQSCVALMSAAWMTEAQAASNWHVVSPDETVVSGQLVATVNPLTKTGSGVAIIAPTLSTNNVTTSVDIQAGTLQLNVTTANAFGSGNANIPVTIQDAATLAACLSGGLTLANNITVGSGSAATAHVSGLGWDGSGNQTRGPYAVELSGQLSQPADNSGNSVSFGGGGVVTVSGNNQSPAHPLTGGFLVEANTTLAVTSATAVPSGLTNGVNLAAATAVLKLDVAAAPTIAAPINCNSGGEINSAQAATLSSNIYNNSSNALTVSGAAVTTLSGNHYSSGTTQGSFPINITGAGLKISGSTITTGDIDVAAGASLQVTGNKTLTGKVTFG
jgi:hypothetical protein